MANKLKLGYSERNAITNDMGCAGANISLYDSDGTVILNAVCGSLPSTLYTSKGNNLTLEVNSAGGNGTEISFNAHFTSFFIGSNYFAIKIVKKALKDKNTFRSFLK